MGRRRALIAQGGSVMPIKGQLIAMDLGNGSKQYRVLKINGTVAEVLAMYDYSTSCKFESYDSNIYSGSNLDTKLNITFYNTLSVYAKLAIIDKSITQYLYTYNDSYYNATNHVSYAGYSTKATKGMIGNRHIYALDVEDIEEYFNNIFGAADIYELFWNTPTRPSTITYPWLRSASSGNSNRAWYIGGSAIYDNRVINLNAARPAFQIDLSKIDYEIVSS